MNITALLEEIKDDLAQVESTIYGELDTEIPLIYEVGQYILESGGKRLRPALAIYAARVFGTAGQSVYTAAGSLEYLHTATLLHDDVVDDADTRRGRPAARINFGNAASVLVGDYLLATAFRSLTRLGSLEVLDTISYTTSLMAKGEILQLIRSYDTATEEDYLAIITYKTACLFAAAAKIGGVFGGADKAQQEALYNYGNDLGIAFQIVDDALDYAEERDQVGKPLGIDLKERKITLPLSRLLQVATPPQQETLQAILARDEISDEDVHTVTALMREHEVPAYALAEARRFAERGKAGLDVLPATEERDVLLRLADYVVERRF